MANRGEKKFLAAAAGADEAALRREVADILDTLYGNDAFESVAKDLPLSFVLLSVCWRQLEYSRRAVQAAKDGRTAARDGFLREADDLASRVRSLFQSGRQEAARPQKSQAHEGARSPRVPVAALVGPFPREVEALLALPVLRPHRFIFEDWVGADWSPPGDETRGDAGVAPKGDVGAGAARPRCGRRRTAAAEQVRAASQSGDSTPPTAATVVVKRTDNQRASPAGQRASALSPRGGALLPPSKICVITTPGAATERWHPAAELLPRAATTLATPIETPRRTTPRVAGRGLPRPSESLASGAVGRVQLLGPGEMGVVIASSKVVAGRHLSSPGDQGQWVVEETNILAPLRLESKTPVRRYKEWVKSEAVAFCMDELARLGDSEAVARSLGVSRGKAFCCLIPIRMRHNFPESPGHLAHSKLNVVRVGVRRQIPIMEQLEVVGSVVSGERKTLVFVIVHELTHCALWHRLGYHLPSPEEERFCDSFATKYLLVTANSSAELDYCSRGTTSTQLCI